eukprot:TRINITY_DN15220_c0_g1_i1.p1 TRINITY_DN15220_c0_g1~~TRINITY_DN15220_c0_g1_i1.p1  ORF type:complete len:519 (-),score=77.45 TRINITY_DN15220_c0_g1_i1:97-1653(-)
MGSLEKFASNQVQITAEPAEAYTLSINLAPKADGGRKFGAANAEGVRKRRKSKTFLAQLHIMKSPAGFEWLNPVSKPHRAYRWSLLRVLSTRMLCNASPTRMYEAYLKGLFLAHGLVQVSVDISFETTMQCWKPRSTWASSHRQGVPLVLLHGFGASAIAQWDAQVGDLTQTLDLYIPNLIFFGSSYTTSKNRSIDFQVDCVFKLMQHFQVHKFDVLGFSYGGAIAHRMAARYPDNVRRVVIADEGIMMTRADLVKMQQELGIDDGNGFWKLPSLPGEVRKLEQIAFRNPMWLPDVMYQDVINAMFAENQKEWNELLYEYTIDRPDDPADNPRLTQNVLLTWGEDDPMAPLSFGKDLQRHFGENCRLVVIKRAKHMAHAQHPREFNHLIMDFLLSPSCEVHSGKVATVLQRLARDPTYECALPITREESTGGTITETVFVELTETVSDEEGKPLRHHLEMTMVSASMAIPIAPTVVGWNGLQEEYGNVSTSTSGLLPKREGEGVEQNPEDVDSEEKGE